MALRFKDTDGDIWTEYVPGEDLLILIDPAPTSPMNQLARTREHVERQYGPLVVLR